ncbi:hypothetical protein [Methanolobus sp. WCC4]|uniref:hypothetical protein n=1 Tax=Methanolobus sp. WCC4 TaxID=3125784 RepID=UPI0030FBA68E
MTYEYLFLLSLILTIAIETSLLFIVVRHFFKVNKENISDPILLFAGFFASFATLPYLWFVLPFFIREHHVYVASGETFVFLVESLIYYFVLDLPARKVLILSFVCNLISFLAGLLLFPII